MGGVHAGLQRTLKDGGNSEPSVELSEAVRQSLDQAVITLLNEAQARAETILTTQRELLNRVREALLARRVLDANALAELAKQQQ